MERTVSKSARLRPEVAHLAQRRAWQLGVTFTDLVEDGLCQVLGLARDPRLELLLEIGRLVTSQWRGDDGFPPDAVRVVFREIRTRPDLARLYDDATTGSSGCRDEEKRLALNRLIGRVVAHSLLSRVVGRAVCDDPEDLIESYALLARLVC